MDFFWIGFSGIFLWYRVPEPNKLQITLLLHYLTLAGAGDVDEVTVDEMT